jgi:hypothetical protein
VSVFNPIPMPRKNLVPVKLLVYSLLIGSIISCNSKQRTQAFQGESFIVISQSGSTYKLGDGSKTIELKRKNFDIRWWDNAYAFEDQQLNTIQIAVDTTPSVFNGIKPGILVDNASCFAPGSGAAGPQAKPYESIFLGSDVHHYIFFENDENRRANVITQSGNIYHLEWPIEKIYINEKDTPISEFNGQNLYFVVFQNHNMNDLIDHNELLLLTVKFVD